MTYPVGVPGEKEERTDPSGRTDLPADKTKEKGKDRNGWVLFAVLPDDSDHGVLRMDAFGSVSDLEARSLGSNTKVEKEKKKKKDMDVDARRSKRRAWRCDMASKRSTTHAWRTS